MKMHYVCGVPRSGTTFFARSLANNIDGQLISENDFTFKFFSNDVLTSRLFDNILSSSSKSFLLLDEQIRLVRSVLARKGEISSLKDRKALYVDFISLNNKTTSTFVDSYPGSLNFIDKLSLLSDECNVYFLIRDPRSVYASVKNLPWGPNTPPAFCLWYKKFLLDYFIITKSMAINLFYYEDVVNNYEKIFPDQNPEYVTPYALPKYTVSQHLDVNKTPLIENICKWKNSISADELSYIEQNLHLEMDYFNYTPAGNSEISVRAMKFLKWDLQEYGKSYFNSLNRKYLRNRN